VIDTVVVSILVHYLPSVIAKSVKQDVSF